MQFENFDLFNEPILNKNPWDKSVKVEENLYYWNKEPIYNKKLTNQIITAYSYLKNHGIRFLQVFLEKYLILLSRCNKQRVLLSFSKELLN